MDIREEDETDEIQPEEMDENLSISLHAITGTPTPQTMRVKANVEGKVVIILIDTGSTYNFMSENMAARLKLQHKGTTKFNVTGASGEKIPSNGRCPRIRVALQGTTLISDFYLLPLKGFDAVLGAQWLATFGPILWDFSKMSMRFHLNGREVEWKRLTTPTNRMIDEGKMKQEIQKERKGILLQLFALTTKTTTTFNPQRWPSSSSSSDFGSTYKAEQRRGSGTLAKAISPTDATWEDAQSLRLRFSELSLEDKGAL
ncbi:RVP_2 domain-containing protein [Fagus crenata]